MYGRGGGEQGKKAKHHAWHFGGDANDAKDNNRKGCAEDRRTCWAAGPPGGDFYGSTLHRRRYFPGMSEGRGEDQRASGQMLCNLGSRSF